MLINDKLGITVIKYESGIKFKATWLSLKVVVVCKFQKEKKVLFLGVGILETNDFGTNSSVTEYRKYIGISIHRK